MEKDGLPDQKHKLDMPPIKGFRILDTFRLFIATKPIEELPQSFLQSTLQIVLEPPKGIRLNVVKSLHSASLEYYGGCREMQAPFRQLFFALTFYHAVMSERNKFGTLGWSRPYNFLPSDLKISSLQIL